MDRFLNEQIKTLPPKEGRLSITTDGIYLDKGELPYPPSPGVIQAITQAASTVNRYPEILGGALRSALANYAGVQKEQIVIGNGSDDLIELILKIFVKPGEDVLLPIPTFFVYYQATQLVGGNCVFINRTADFGLEVSALLEKVTEQTKVLFIANPNNPTANLIPRSVIVSILEQLDCMVVVDECYYEFSGETVVDLIDQYPRLIVLRSLSKSFGLAGLRVGYAITNESIAQYLYRAAQLFPVGRLALVGAIAALEDRSYAYSNIERISQERTQVAKALSTLGFTVYPSRTNFLFVGTQSLGFTSKVFVAALAKRHIFIQDFGLKPGLDAFYFRVSMGTPEENQQFITAAREAL